MTVVQPVEPGSYIRGVNGDYGITAIEATWWWLDDLKTTVHINGIGKRGVAIKGGLRIDAGSLLEWCQRIVAELSAIPHPACPPGTITRYYTVRSQDAIPEEDDEVEIVTVDGDRYEVLEEGP